MAAGSAFQGFHHHHLTCSAPPLGQGPAPGQVVEKVKFTVSVQGHQWSSARHVHETLQEFARVIERNARRLEFIGEGDSIQRLQLVRPDGSEPEELDVDATLEDVLICMGDKQLVAIISSTKDIQDGNEEKPSPSPSAGTDLQMQRPKAFFPKNDTPSSYSLTPTSAPTGEDVDSPVLCPKSPPRFKPGLESFKTSSGLPMRGLKISIPSCEYSSPVFSDDGAQDCRQGERRTETRAAKSSAMGYCTGSGLPGLLMSSNNATPSPAELAQFLVRGSSNRMGSHGNGVHANPRFVHCTGAAVPMSGGILPNAGFQSFVPSMLARTSNGFPANTPSCPQGAPNIALLAQFLASQLRAFTPANDSQQHAGEVCAKHGNVLPNEPVVNGHRTSAAELGHCISQQVPKLEAANVLGSVADINSLKMTNGAKALISESHDDKDASSSSANMTNMEVPSPGLMDNDPMKGRSDLVFLVNRRSKMGVGTHHLRMSDLSAYFHLSIVDAAKKLGVSQTTLKKACRKFGLKRWPGRKVRSLESTIHGLEHTIAVGQGAGMEDLTEAYMRSEVTKLQQEMDQLVHGIPAAQQHLPLVRTADLYKRLYSRGWRSKFHSPCSRFDLDLNTDTRDNKESNQQHHLDSFECAWKTSQETKDTIPAETQCHTRQESEAGKSSEYFTTSRLEISRETDIHKSRDYEEGPGDEPGPERTPKRPKVESQ